MPCSRVLRAKRALRGALHPAEGQKELAQLRTSNQSLQQQVTDAQAIATKTMAMQRQMRRGTASSDDVALAEQHSAVRRPPRGRGGGGSGGREVRIRIVLTSRACGATRLAAGTRQRLLRSPLNLRRGLILRKL